MNSHYKEKAVGVVWFILQREPGPSVFMAACAKRLQGFLKG